MKIIKRPFGWPEMTEQDFEKYLKTCWDYRREGYVGSAEYYYAYNKQAFGVIVNGKVFVDPNVVNSFNAVR